MSKATNGAIKSTYTVTDIVHRCSGDEYDDYPSTRGIHATWRQRHTVEDRVWLPGYFKWDNDAKFCPQCGIELMTGRGIPQFSMELQ